MTHSLIAHLLRPRIRVLLAVTTVVFSCLLLNGSTQSQQGLPEALRNEFQAGVAAEKSGHLEEAEKDFLDVLQQGGNIAFVHHNLGTIYQQQGDHVRAIAEFREAIHLQPQLAPAHILLGASLIATHKIPDAIRELQRAVELAPREPSVHMELAKAYELSGAAFGVVKEYQILTALDPANPEYTYQLGRAYMNLSKWCIMEIRQRGPDSSRRYETLAEALMGQGQTERAIHFFQRAGHADPKLPGIHLALAQIYLQQNRPEDARREIEQELTLVPESVAAKALQQQIAAKH